MCVSIRDCGRFGVSCKPTLSLAHSVALEEYSFVCLCAFGCLILHQVLIRVHVVITKINSLAHNSIPLFCILGLCCVLYSYLRPVQDGAPSILPDGKHVAGSAAKSHFAPNRRWNNASLATLSNFEARREVLHVCDRSSHIGHSTAGAT